jgi:NAD(P)H dehydrogenase (quinone)
VSGPLILVTGATGKTGSAVTEQLLARGARVRALVRARDARSQRLHELGAEVVVADMFDPVQVGAAMNGVSRLYYLPPYHSYMLQSAAVFATAASRAGVEAIVGLSQWLVNPSHPSLATRQNWLVERLFGMVPGAAHVTVNPGFFADNYLGNGFTGLASQLGVWPVPMGNGRNAPPSNEDIARVAVGALLDPERHAGRSYRPTGPELLSADEMAEAIGDAVGRRVRHLDVSLRTFLKAVRVTGPRAGVDEALMAEVRWYYEEGKLGTWEIGAPTTHVRDVAGVEPEGFAAIARRYAARPDAERTAGNLARAAWDFARIGLAPAPRLDRFVRDQRQPVPPGPELSARSEVWAREHRVEKPRPVPSP